MKEKKGKKSLETLETLDNSLKRSTRLIEFAKSLSTQQLGTNNTSILTTSSSVLPPSIYISGTSITSIENTGLSFCEKIGGYYEATPCPVRETYFDLDDNFLDLKLVSNKVQGNQKGAGWRFNVIPKDWSSVVRGAPPRGYLFVYFHTSYERNKCRDFLDDKRVGGVCSNVISGKPNSRDYNQGKIFAVVISNISQINALNQKYYEGITYEEEILSIAILNAINVNFTLESGKNGFFVRDFMNDITNIYDPTQFFAPKNPIEIVANYIEYINFKDFIVPGNDFFSESAVVPLKTFIVQKIFKDGYMGSIKFTVNKNSSILFESIDPWSAQLNVSIPNINSTNVNNTGVLELPIDESVNIYITKKRVLFPAPRSLTFSVLFTQPFYELSQNTFYLPKTLSLKFMVTF